MITAQIAMLRSIIQLEKQALKETEGGASHEHQTFQSRTTEGLKAVDAYIEMVLQEK